VEHEPADLVTRDDAGVGARLSDCRIASPIRLAAAGPAAPSAKRPASSTTAPLRSALARDLALLAGFGALLGCRLLGLLAGQSGSGSRCGGEVHAHVVGRAGRRLRGGRPLRRSGDAERLERRGDVALQLVRDPAGGEGQGHAHEDEAHVTLAGNPTAKTLSCGTTRETTPNAASVSVRASTTGPAISIAETKTCVKAASAPCTSAASCGYSVTPTTS